MWYGEGQARLVMFWQWMCLLDVPLQCCTFVCAHTHTHTPFLICVCTIVPSVCTEPAESVKIRARLGPEILNLIEGVRGRIPPQLNYTIWHIVCSYHSFMVELLKGRVLLILHLREAFSWNFQQWEHRRDTFPLRSMTIRSPVKFQYCIHGEKYCHSVCTNVRQQDGVGQYGVEFLFYG